MQAPRVREGAEEVPGVPCMEYPETGMTRIWAGTSNRINHQFRGWVRREGAAKKVGCELSLRQKVFRLFDSSDYQRGLTNAD